MKLDSYSEIIISVLLLVSLFFFVDPLMTVMERETSVMASYGLIFLVILFIGVLWREKPRDEREEIHREKAGRLAYLSGVLVLSLGIAYQATYSYPDKLLIVTLGIMVLVKLAGLLYIRIRR